MQDYQHILWFNFVRAFVAMIVAVVGFTLATIGLVRPDRSRRRAVIGVFAVPGRLWLVVRLMTTPNAPIVFDL
jgi:hypothetical protein